MCIRDSPDTQGIEMTGQRIGYVRVSSFDQNPERQLDGTQVDRTFTDKASGKDVKRPELEALMGFARTGDTVVVHSMDRLARNLDDLRRIVQTLTQRGVCVDFIKEHLVFTVSYTHLDVYKRQDGEFAQVEQGMGGREGDAVIGADGRRQAALLEQALEGREGENFAGRFQRLAQQKVA